MLLQPTRQDRQRTIANANRPKTHDDDKAVLVFQPACLCSNSCENDDARQMRIMDQEMDGQVSRSWSVARAHVQCVSDLEQPIQDN